MTLGDDRLRSQLDLFRAKHSVPALGAGVVTRDGLVEIDVVGVRARNGEDPVERGDAWHIGSCCKSITAALYARLVERGDAEWGARLPDLFPDLAGAADPGWGSITIDEVFVGQAGIPANLGRAEMKAASRDTRPLREQRTEATAAVFARPPRRPGRFLYSNLGYIVIGAAIERITDLPFEAALATHVLEPLGITSGGFGPPGELRGHGGRMLALGPLGMFDLGGKAPPADPGAAESDNPAVMSPAGRLHLSLEDWAAFQRVYLTQGDFLRPETIEHLLTPATGRGYRQAFGWAPAQFGSASLGQQGSNSFWVATALMDRERGRTAMVVCNEGRARLLKDTPNLAAQLLSSA